MCDYPHPDTIVPHDRRAITATIIGVGVSVDHRTGRHRVTVRHADGWTAGGLVPWSEVPRVGQDIEMTVTLHPSEHNPKTGRFARASRVRVGEPYEPAVGDVVLMNKSSTGVRWCITAIHEGVYAVTSLRTGRVVLTDRGHVLRYNVTPVARWGAGYEEKMSLVRDLRVLKDRPDLLDYIRYRLDDDALMATPELQAGLDAWRRGDIVEG